MKVAPHVIVGIEVVNEENIKYLKYKIAELIGVYYECDSVSIVVSNIDLTKHYERTIVFLGSVEPIINEIKEMYKTVKFKPYTISFDFIVSKKKEDDNNSN